MLNSSAGSWGPNNSAAYLKKKGLFGAKTMFLLISNHDGHDNTNFQPAVGVYPSYPDKQYKLALMVLLEKYVLPKISKKKNMVPDPD